MNLQMASISLAGFYEGWIAEDIVTFLQSKGGLHTLQDFSEGKGEFINPIKLIGSVNS